MLMLASSSFRCSSKDLRDHLLAEAKRADAGELAAAEARAAEAAARQVAEAARTSMEKALAEAQAMQAALQEKTAQVLHMRCARMVLSDVTVEPAYGNGPGMNSGRVQRSSPVPFPIMVGIHRQGTGIRGLLLCLCDGRGRGAVQLLTLRGSLVPAAARYTRSKSTQLGYRLAIVHTQPHTFAPRTPGGHAARPVPGAA